MAKKTTGVETEDSAKKVMEQKIMKDLRFPLSDTEKDQLANTAAKLTEERNAKKTELDLIGRNMRKDIKDTQKEIDRLLKCHKDGAEMRNVECTERLDWDAKTVQYYHDGKMVLEREMHDTELQMRLNTNETLKVKKDKRTKSQKNPEKHLTPEEQRESEIAQVHKLETSKKSKKSAVDNAH